MSDSIEEVRIARRAFAIEEAKRIRDCLQQMEESLWKTVASKAKLRGLYSTTTYNGDIATGLQAHAGIRYQSMIRDFFTETTSESEPR